MANQPNKPLDTDKSMAQVVEKTSPPAEVGGLAASAQRWNDYFDVGLRFAKASCMSQGINPDKQPDECMQRVLRVVHGFALGLDPLTAIDHIYVVGDKFGISAEMLRAFALRSGLVKKWEAEYDAKAKVFTIYAERRDNGAYYRVNASLSEFKHLQKPDSGWAKYPSQMLQARATSWMVKALFPDTCMGALTIEELEEVSKAPVSTLKQAKADPLVTDRRFDEADDLDAIADRAYEHDASVKLDDADPVVVEPEAEVVDVVDNAEVEKPKPKPRKRRAKAKVTAEQTPSAPVSQAPKRSANIEAAVAMLKAKETDA